MQITLNHDEIVSALQTYVRSQITVAEDQDIVIDLKAGRGDNGFSATLDIVPAGMSRSTAPEPKPVTQTKPVATPASKPAAITSTPEDRKDPADEPKAEPEKPKPAAKAKPTFGIKKAEPKAEPEPVADEPEEDDGDGDGEPVVNETVNTMAGGAGGASGPEEEAPAPKPRGIFAKVGNG